MSMKSTPSAVLLPLVLVASWTVAGCSVPKMLQEPFEQGVYEDILERQAEGVEIDQQHLEDLPAMTAGDYERIGDTYLSRGQRGLARIKYQKALELDPRSWRLEYKIGTILLQGGAPGDALPYFRSITARDPTNSRGYEGEGRCLFAAGDHEGAERILRKAVRLDSGSWKSHMALGMLYVDLGRLDEAIAAYRAALKARPNEASILNNLGVAFYLKKDYASSIATLERALRSSRPEDRKRVYNNLGRSLARSGNYKRAIDAFRRASSLAKAYNNLGILLMEEDRPRAAAACFQKAIDASPSYYEAARENLIVALSDGGGGQDPSVCP